MLATAIASLAPLHAQVSESLAVLDLEGRGISSIEAASLTDRLRTDLVGTHTVTVVERGQMEQILLEQDFQMTGCTSNECAVEVGQLLGVTTIVAGSIGRVGLTFTIDVRTIDVESGRITGSLKRDFRGEIDGLLDIMTDLANELAGTAMAVPAPSEPVPRVATMAVESRPPGAVILLDGDAIGFTPLDEAEIEPGRPHNLTLSLSGYEQLDTIFIAQAGQNYQWNVSLKQLTNWLSIQGDAGSRVIIDGQYYGKLPMDRVLLPTGEHNLFIRKPEYYTYRDKVLIQQEQEAAVNFSLRKKPKLPALAFSTVIPGSGQLYQGHTGKGLLFLIGVVGVAYYAYDCQSEFIEDYDLFKTRRTEYRDADELDDIEAAKILMEESYNIMKDSEQLRDVMFGVLGGAWFINIVDVTF